MLDAMVNFPIVTPVWDADRLLGHVKQRRSGQIEAIRANGMNLGLFTTERAALLALLGPIGSGSG